MIMTANVSYTTSQLKRNRSYCEKSVVIVNMHFRIAKKTVLMPWLIALLALFTANCTATSSAPQASPPWQDLRLIAKTAPQQQIALLVNGADPLLAWPTGPGVST